MRTLEPGAVTHLLRSEALEEQLQAMQRQLAEVKQLQQSNTSLGQAAYGDILTSMRAVPLCV